MSFIRNVSMTFATKVALFLVGLVTSIVMARILGPEGKGLFSLAVLVAAIVFNSTNMGIGTGSGYFLGRRKIPLETVAGNWLSLSLLIGLAVLAVSLILAPAIVPRLLPSVPVWAVVISLFSIPFSILTYNFLSLFKASNDFRRFNQLDMIQPSAFLVLFVVMMALYPERRVTAAVAAFILSAAVGGAGALMLARRVTRLGFRWRRELIGKALRFGVQGYLANFLGFLNYRLDMFLVNFFLEPRFVGYYSISVMVAEKVWYVPDVLSAVLHPRVARSSEGEANRDTAMVSRLTVVLIGLGCLGILLLGRFLIGLLYSEAFLPAVTPLFILLPGIFAISLAKILASDLLARGYPRINMWAGLTALTVNIVLNILLIPRYGVSGAALATSVSYTLDVAVIATAFVKITGLSPVSILVPRREDLRFLLEKIRSGFKAYRP